MYKIITVETKDGAKNTTKYCDYYMRDGFLTVFREEEQRDCEAMYYKFYKHYSLDCVKSIECIEK